MKNNLGELNAEQYLLAFIKWATELSPEEQEIWDNLQQKDKESKKQQKQEQKILKRQKFKERIRLNREKRMLKKFGYNLPKLDTPNFRTIVKDPLTQTETEILEDLKNGLGFKEIAEKRCISETTVKTHVNSIYQKKQVHNLQQLLVKEFKCREQNKITNIMQGMKILNMKL